MKPLAGEYATYEWFSRDTETWESNGNSVTIDGTDYIVERLNPTDIPQTRHNEAVGTIGGTRTARRESTRNHNDEGPKPARSASQPVANTNTPENTDNGSKTRQRAVEGRKKPLTASTSPVVREKTGKSARKSAKSAAARNSRSRRRAGTNPAK
jgi:hypothetical protein